MISKLLRGRRLRRVLPATLLGVVTGLSLLSTQAQALSVGRINVSSFLNEPFRATVPLNSLQPGELEQLRVELADDAAFARLGLEKSRFLNTLKFTVREGSEAGTAVVSVNSREAAKEPFFGLLMEFRGLGGRIIREYTVLLDPNTGQRQRSSTTAVQAPAPVPAVSQPRAPVPAAAAVQAPPVAPAPRSAATTAPATPPATTNQSPSKPARAPQAQPFQGGDQERKVAVPSPEFFQGEEAQIEVPAVAPATPSTEGGGSNAGNTYGPVAAGMTLWQIAEAVRPSNKLSMNQVMWGLYSSNEDKFDGNLNLIRRGATLRVPSAQAMRNVSPGEAAALVDDQAAQYQARLKRIRQASIAAAAPQAAEQLSVETAPTAAPAARRQIEERPRDLPKANSNGSGAAAERKPEARSNSAMPADETDDRQAPNLSVVEEPMEPPVEMVEEAELEELPALPEDSSTELTDNEYEDLQALPSDDLAQAEAGEEYADLPPLPDDETGAEQGASFDDSGMDNGEAADDAANQQDSGGLLGWLLAALGILVAGVLALFAFRRRGSSSDAPVSDFAKADSATDFATDTSNVKTRPMPEFDDAAVVADASDATATMDFGSNATESDLDMPDLDSLAAADDQAEPEFGDTAIFQAGANDQVASHDVDFGDTEITPAVTDADVPAREAGSAADEGGVETLDMGDDMAGDDLDGGTQTLDLGSETVSLELNEDPLSEADFQLAYGLYDEAALLLNRAIENDPDRLELREKLAETYFATSDADNFKQAALALKDKNPDAETWQRISIMGQQLSPQDELFAGDLASDAGGGVDLDMDFDGADDSAEAAHSVDFDMPDVAELNTTAEDRVAAAPDDNVLEFELDDALDNSAAESSVQAPASATKEDDFDADFGSLTMETDSDGDDDLPELDDLDLGDLEAELESDVSDTELGLDTQTGDAGDVLGAGTDFDLESTLGDDAAQNLEADTEQSAEATDFSLDDIGLDSDDLDSDGADNAQSTDFDLDSISLDEDASSDSEFDLGEATDQATDFDLDALATDDADEADLDLSSLTADADDDGDFSLDDLGESDADQTDFDLDSLTEGDDGADIDLDSLSLDDDGPAGEVTDFDLDNPVGELPPEPPAEETDFELDDLGGTTDFDLDEVSSGAEDISGGDEAGTKLDLARAYVDMGENDMARSLLDEVSQAGSDAQKAEAQELLGKL